MPGTIWVIAHIDGWIVKCEGRTAASRSFTTQREAIGYGRQLAKTHKADLVIQKRKDKMRDHDSKDNASHLFLCRPKSVPTRYK